MIGVVGKPHDMGLRQHCVNVRSKGGGAMERWMLGYREGSIAGAGSYVTPSATPSVKHGRALCRRTVRTCDAKSPRHHKEVSR